MTCATGAVALHADERLRRISRALEGSPIGGDFSKAFLSCAANKRTPDGAGRMHARERMRLRHARCLSTGNRPSRDSANDWSVGTSGPVVQRDSPKAFRQTRVRAQAPGQFVDKAKDPIGPLPLRKKRQGRTTEKDTPLYDVSLSSMWANKASPTLQDFFVASQRLGFSRIELNHQVSSAMLAGIALDHFQFSSVHEPCPADVSAETLKARDWVISALDGNNRREGVEAVKRSIDLAHELKAPVVVMHAGHVPSDLALEDKLRALYAAGERRSLEYQAVMERLVASRGELVGPHLEAVRQSLGELLGYAGRLKVRLGLENRYHYMDIPNLDEMGLLLGLRGPDQLGFVYDVGHAQALDRLGFFAHQEWLERYASRMIGAHLHDVIGVADHYAPGLGEVDFDMVAAYLPSDVVRTCELEVSNSAGQVRAGLEFLVDHGCIRRL